MNRLYSPQLDVILTEISVRTDGRGRDVRSCGYVDEFDPWKVAAKTDAKVPVTRDDFDRRVLFADAVSRDDDHRPARKLTGARFFVDELVVLIP